MQYEKDDKLSQFSATESNRWCLQFKVQNVRLHLDMFQYL